MPLVRKPPPAAPAQPDDAAGNLQDLARTLREGADDARWNAARAAAATADGLAVLRDALPRESHPRVREAIFTGLARIGSVGSAQAVLPFLRSDDSSLRTAALDALLAMPAASVAELIPAVLTDADADVRLLACELVRNQPGADAGRMLGAVLATEPEANVCAAAIEVLAETGGPELLPLLAQCAARFPGDPFLAFAVKAAAERIGSEAIRNGSQAMLRG
jgi:HEAT repeat protein